MWDIQARHRTRTKDVHRVRISLPGVAQARYLSGMSTQFTGDADIISFLWTTLFGETGFSCECGCTKGYARRPIGRSKVCKACRREISVTAETLMRKTKLPLLAWVRALESTDLPSSRALADEFDVAPSSGWHLLVRVMVPSQHRAVEAIDRTEVVRVALRPPQRPMTPAAPEHIVSLDAAGTLEVLLRVGLAGDRAWPGEIGVDPAAFGSDPICARLVDELRHRGGVSLRWLPRWTAALLDAWSAANPRPWWRAVCVAPIPLRRLDPWLCAA